MYKGMKAGVNWDFLLKQLGKIESKRRRGQERRRWLR